ncbi:hypothetical protein L211DRAFT_900835 [Terfezia boudieri ATCC MYA-4762]|uniref:Uncharacterized protein n=1 Tax=Terfezia boudieri ATCC MYA-4762 TaxID=1051890 RepID=A0A3N4M879_9PEZI|nr:hypothetical protein L211DRAFT_900835 [Terfezia boudieri ATCC MYA-4762]
MAQHFGGIHDGQSNILPKILRGLVLLPQIKHLKSANVFIEDDVTGSHTLPDETFARTIVQPVLENVEKFSRLANLEISGQENLTPAFGSTIKAIRPSFIGQDNKRMNRTRTFSLRITGARRVWTGVPNPTEEFHRNKGFLDALNENSVTMVDFDLTDDWGWNLDHISEFLIRQARTLKAMRLRGIGDTVNTWQLLDRMGRRGCRMRGLDLENRHVHHPPVVFEPTAWAFKSGLLKKLRYLAVEGFQGITNSTTNYHMIDPTSFSILLKHNLFGGKSTGRFTPPIKTLVLNRTTTGTKVPEQIGAFVMHLAPTLTTLELAYLSNEASTGDFTSLIPFREQGRYKFIEVLMKLTQLKRLKAVGYAAEVLLCSCIDPTQADDAPDQGVNMGNVSRPRSPPRPSTPVGHNSSANVADMGSPNFYNHSTPPPPLQYQPVTRVMLPSSHRRALSTQNPPAFRLFTNTWRSSLEELQLMPSGQTVFTVHGGLVDDTLWLFTQPQKLRLFTLLFGALDNGAEGDEEGLLLRQWHFNGVGDDDDDQRSSSSGIETGDLQQVNTPGKITPDGVLRFVNALPRMTLLRERTVMQKFWIGRRFMNPERSGPGDSRVAENEKWPQWAVHIAETMKDKGMEFVLA